MEIDKQKLTITVERVFDAPRMMVWAATTDPSLIRLWWGPKAYETIVEKFDLKPEGEWRIIHRDADGKEFGFHGVTREVVLFDRVVQTFNYEGIPAGHELVQTMVLEEMDGGKKTKLTQVAQYQNIQDLEGMVASGMEKGLTESFDRLAELTRAKKELTLVRVFDAPREKVFRAWTDPKLVAQWWGPRLFSNPVCEIDARPGGAIVIHMQGPDGNASPMRGTFEEVKEPERIVFTSRAFLGEGGEPDLENRNTVTFEDSGGKTKVTLRVVVLKSTPVIQAALSGMEMGWSQSFDKLGDLVSAA